MRERNRILMTDTNANIKPCLECPKKCKRVRDLLFGIKVLAEIGKGPRLSAEADELKLEIHNTYAICQKAEAVRKIYKDYVASTLGLPMVINSKIGT
jgi:hypothetical protein